MHITPVLTVTMVTVRTFVHFLLYTHDTDLLLQGSLHFKSPIYLEKCVHKVKCGGITMKEHLY